MLALIRELINQFYLYEAVTAHLLPRGPPEITRLARFNI